jgi:hypothetical protein
MYTSGRKPEEEGGMDLPEVVTQETWEDSPPGWPLTAPYEWWRRHDEYEEQR